MAASYAYAKTDIVQLIRDEINEPTARIFSGTGADDGDLDRFIDAGAALCSSLTFCYEVEEDETCVASQYAYSPSTYNFIKIESVEYVDNETVDLNYGLQRIHPQAYGHIISTTTGRPLYYFEHRTTTLPKVYVLPAPTTAMGSASDIIRIKGYASVIEFGDAGGETLPSGLQIVPLYYALSCVYARLGKHRLSAFNMQKFIDECNRWRIDSNGSTRMVDSDDLTKIPDTSVITP